MKKQKRGPKQEAKKRKTTKKKAVAKKRRYTSPKFKSKTNKASVRSQKKLRALLPEYNLKTRFDLLEIDEKYMQDLKNNPEVAEWLNKFNTEFVNASFNTHKNHLHRSKSAKRECYARNNARNRCIYTREKAQGKLDSIEDLKEEMKRLEENFENDYIDTLDNNKELSMSEKFNNLKKGSNKPDDSTDT